MSSNTFDAALAALRCWCAAVTGDAPPPLAEPVRRAAWLAAGQPPAAGLPTIDLDKPLASVFSRVMRQDGGEPPEIYVRRAPLALDNTTLFPATSPDEAAGEIPAAALREALAQLDPRLLPPAQVEGLLFALQRHAWCLPSPLPGVSLYDYARVHAALAAALADSPDGDLFLLGGDLSGVQRFIYTLQARGAARQLRGRSLYLQLLTEAIARWVLAEIELPTCNLLYCGGGRFYVLLPAEAEERLPALRQYIGERLLHRHGNALFMALGGARYVLADGSQRVWERVNDELDIDKRRRFAALDPSLLDNLLFTPRSPLQDTGAESDTPMDALSESFVQLAPQLHNIPYLLMYSVRAPDLRTAPAAIEPVSWHRVLREFRLFARPIDDLHRQRPRAHNVHLLALRDVDEDQRAQAYRWLGPDGILGTRYTVTVAATATDKDVEKYRCLELDDDGQELRVGDIKPFSLLAYQSQGIKRLGVLRMDVDDLGDLFGRRQRPTPGIGGIAVSAALSAALSRFFEGWVGELCQRANSSGDGGIYAVYSGGDDLFIVGSWHLLPELAATIRKDFIRYTTAHAEHSAPPITLSAGITLHPAKYPLYQAAEDAHDALEASKGYTCHNRKKDALTFLGQTIGWEQYAEVDTLHNELCSLIEQGAPRALLTTILSLYERYRTSQKRNRFGAAQFDYGPWVWKGAYMLTRMAERSPKEIRPSVLRLRDRIIGEVEGRFIERAGLAARWTQLLLRDKEEARCQDDTSRQSA